MLQAQFLQIELCSTFEGFGLDFQICSDKQRIQQVLLNLQSNALKFTQSGGQVVIKCKLIKHEDDLEFIGHLQYFKDASNGLIQVTVSDTGVGIQDKDKDKLFQLFGFLETTKELNTKGIGLGLHISKQIVQQFGGDISFESQWGRGSSFTFVMALEKETKSLDKISRNKNPKIKSYPKIKVIRKEELGATLQDTSLKLSCPISELMSLNKNGFDIPVPPTILNLDSIQPEMVPTQRILIVDDEPYNLLALTTILA